MRILFWAEFFQPLRGGASVAATRLAQQLTRAGHELLVIADKKAFSLPEEDSCGNLPVFRLPMCAALDAGNIKAVSDLSARVRALSDGFKPDIIHACTGWPSYFFCRKTARTGHTPFLATVHQLYRPEELAPNSIMGLTLRHADWVVCVSKASMQEARQAIPEIAPRSSCIYHGVDIPASPSPYPPTTVPTALFVGRLAPEKGVDLVLQAWPVVQERLPEARLVIVGDGDERQALEARAERLGIIETVTFRGWVSSRDIRSIMQAAHVLVMPSRTEGLGLAGVEAAAAARPLIASRTGGLTEVVEEGRTGLLVQRGNVGEIHRAVIALLGDPERARTMGREAWTLANEKFSWTNCVEAYNELYRMLLNGEV